MMKPRSASLVLEPWWGFELLLDPTQKVPARTAVAQECISALVQCLHHAASTVDLSSA